MNTLGAWQKSCFRTFSTCQTYQNSGVTNNTVGPSKFAHFNPNTFLASSGVTSFGLQSPIRRQGRGNTVGLKCIVKEHRLTMYQRWNCFSACLFPHTTIHISTRYCERNDGPKKQPVIDGGCGRPGRDVLLNTRPCRDPPMLHHTKRWNLQFTSKYIIINMFSYYWYYHRVA
jgi:hypothetical protein